MSNIVSKFEELGLTLPACPAPVAAYVPATRNGDTIIVSGQLPSVKGDASLDTEEISRSLRKSGIPPLMQPGSVFCVEAIPKLGSGKWDFNGMKKLAMELVGSK